MSPLDGYSHGSGAPADPVADRPAGLPPRSQTYPRRYPPETWDPPTRGVLPTRTDTVSPRDVPSPDARPVSAILRARNAAAGSRPVALGWRFGDTIPAALSGLGVAARLGAPRRPADPSPSLLAYRLNRLWLTPLFRRALTMGLPTVLLAGAIALYLADDARRAGVTGLVSDLRLAFESRPEFSVARLEIHSDTPAVTTAIAARLDVNLPASSFHLDLDALRQRVEQLDAVQSAALRIRPGGLLEISVTEREAAFVWRSHQGLALIDSEGHRVALLSHRAARADLPLLAGGGAPEAVAEARRLLAAAAPLGDRLHALVRVGARRWDLVLAGDRRIMLPPQGAVMALERVLALDNPPLDLLSRDLTFVDMRNPDRPTLRLTETALADLHHNRSPEPGARPR